MILLADKFLLFQLADGESVPFSAEAISVEIIGDVGNVLDADLVRNAAAAVFHYFKIDLERQIVTVGEFSQALERVLRGFNLTIQPVGGGGLFSKADLNLLASESGGTELFFYSRLREELRTQLRRSPRTLRFVGLRGCVKQIAGVRRWNIRCRRLNDQIVSYLRECMCAEPEQAGCLLVVE
jgi:hypothetical protein